MTSRTLQKMSTDLFETYRRNAAERGETLTASDDAAHEIIRAWIARFAPDDDALVEALELVRDDIEVYLEPETKGPPSAAETERVSEMVRTYIARFEHDEATLVEALKTVRDHIDDFLLTMFDRIDRISAQV